MLMSTRQDDSIAETLRNGTGTLKQLEEASGYPEARVKSEFGTQKESYPYRTTAKHNREAEEAGRESGQDCCSSVEKLRKEGENGNWI